MTGFAPILLLDEVAAHLDPARRAALFDALSQLGAQVWMTGADPLAFSEISGRAQIFEVNPGVVAGSEIGSPSGVFRASISRRILVALKALKIQ